MIISVQYTSTQCCNSTCHISLSMITLNHLQVGDEFHHLSQSLLVRHDPLPVVSNSLSYVTPLVLLLCGPSPLCGHSYHPNVVSGASLQWSQDGGCTTDSRHLQGPFRWSVHLTWLSGVLDSVGHSPFSKGMPHYCQSWRSALHTRSGPYTESTTWTCKQTNIKAGSLAVATYNFVWKYLEFQYRGAQAHLKHTIHTLLHFCRGDAVALSIWQLRAYTCTDKDSRVPNYPHYRCIVIFQL